MACGIPHLSVGEQLVTAAEHVQGADQVRADSQRDGTDHLDARPQARGAKTGQRARLPAVLAWTGTSSGGLGTQPASRPGSALQVGRGQHRLERPDKTRPRLPRIDDILDAEFLRGGER